MKAWGELELDERARVAFWRGKRLRLSPFETRVLAALIAAEGALVSQADLTVASGCRNSNTLRTRLYQFREKYRDLDRLAGLFEAHSGGGYRLLAPGEDGRAVATVPTGKRALARQQKAARAAAAAAAAKPHPVKSYGARGPTSPAASTLGAAVLPADLHDDDPRRKLRLELPVGTTATLRAAAAVRGMAPQGLAVELVEEALDRRFVGEGKPPRLRFVDLLSPDLEAEFVRQAAAAGVGLRAFALEVVKHGLPAWRAAVEAVEAARLGRRMTEELGQ